jgi:cytochrome c-type biogenesis protein CcmH/NrfF
MTVLRFSNIIKPAFAIIIVLSLLDLASAGVTKPTVDGIASKLSCYCGTCPHLVVSKCGCSVADQIKTEIQQKINAGMTESQIIDSFVAKYGQTALATPPKSGFNLTAWGLPFLGFLIGGVILIAFLRKQQPPSAPDNRNLPLAPIDVGDVYRERLRKELESRK